MKTMNMQDKSKYSEMVHVSNLLDAIDRYFKPENESDRNIINGFKSMVMFVAECEAIATENTDLWLSFLLAILHDAESKEK